MYNDFDDFDSEIDEYLEYDEGYDNYEGCLDCPYLYRQLPFQPQPPPPPFQQQQQQYQQPPPGGYGRPPYGRPPGPPPTKIPFKSKQIGPKAVSPGSLRSCTHRFVYIWLDNGSSFWAWLTRVDKKTASGFRWQNRRWVYFGVDLRRIDSFECY